MNFVERWTRGMHSNNHIWRTRKWLVVWQWFATFSIHQEDIWFESEFWIELELAASKKKREREREREATAAESSNWALRMYPVDWTVYCMCARVILEDEIAFGIPYSWGSSSRKCVSAFSSTPWDEGQGGGGGGTGRGEEMMTEDDHASGSWMSGWTPGSSSSSSSKWGASEVNEILMDRRSGHLSG